MEAIGTSIELNDTVSTSILTITNVLQMAISGFESLQTSINESFDSANIQDVMACINETTISIIGLGDTLSSVFANGVSAPEIPAPTLPPIEPIELPITWKVDDLNIFTSSGIERFQQEIQSTNMLMDRLSIAQESIAQQAMQFDVLPPGSNQDLTSMFYRIEDIRGRISQIESNPLNLGSDVANSGLETLRSQLSSAVAEQELLNRAVEDFDAIGANEAYLRLSATIGDTERYLRDNVDEQGNFNDVIDEASGGYDGLLGKVLETADALGIGTMAKDMAIEMIGAATELEATDVRFNTSFAGMTDDAQMFIDEFQALTPSSEVATRLMASGIQDLLTPMGFARSEATAMTGETMHLVGALTNFYSASETAESVTDKFAEALTGEYDGLKALGIQVDDTAVKQKAVAMGYASSIDAVNSQAEALALLDLAYEQSGGALASYNDESLGVLERQMILKESFRDTLAEAGQSVLPKINNMLVTMQSHMPTIAVGVDAFAGALSRVIDVAGMLLSVIMNIAEVVVNNWSFIEPIVMGIVWALGLYAMYLGIINGLEIISAVTTGALIVAKGLHTAGIWATTSATWAQASAQTGLNATMYACPVIWIITIIGILIAVIYGAVAAFNHFASTSYSATGIIVGALTTAVAFIWNSFLRVLERVFCVIEFWINLFIMFANFLGNVFQNPVSSIINLFADMADSVLGIIEKIVSGMDFVFGSNMADSVAGWRSGLQEMADAAVVKFAPDEDYQKLTDKISLSVEGLGLSRWAYGDAWDTGYDWGANVSDLSSGGFEVPDPNVSIPSTEEAQVVDSINDTALNTTSMSDSLDASAEDLKYMIDLAEVEAINKFTTAEIKIEQTNHNTIRNGQDIDGITNSLTTGLNDAIEKSMEGVHI